MNASTLDLLTSMSRRKAPTERLTEALPSGETLEWITLRAGSFQAVLCSHGARLLAWQGQDGFNVVVGPQSTAEILADQGAMGVTVGRVCNRIRDAAFDIPGVGRFALPKNDGSHHLHGGPGGFHTRFWETGELIVEADSAQVSFHLESLPGDQAYPGHVKAEVIYTLKADGQLLIQCRAQVITGISPLNMTHHAYWNLGFHDQTVLEHVLQSPCDRYQETDASSIPTGELKRVEATLYDFREARSLGPNLPQAKDPKAPNGYDSFLLRPDFQPTLRSYPLSRLAYVRDPRSQRSLELWTDQAGFQLYTGNYLDRPFFPQQAFCLEASAPIDAVNQPDLPSILVQAGESIEQLSLYRLHVPRCSASVSS